MIREKYGEHKCTFPMNYHTRKNKGYAFVTFPTQQVSGKL